MINLQSYALSHNRCKRKTIGFGKYDKKAKMYEDEIYIRELSFFNGGVGCALWDGSIILGRWIQANLELFEGKNVVELGAGVGLPGIVAARVAAESVLTDYVRTLLDNLKYNVWVNSRELDAEEAADIYGSTAAPAYIQRERFRANIASAAKVSFLDWENPHKTIDTPAESSLLPRDARVTEISAGAAFAGRFDFVIGSEIVYLDREYTELADLLEFILKPTGQIIIVLSTDRDGQEGFCRLMSSRGFSFSSSPPPPECLGFYGTRQRPETYLLYRFWRAAE
eukprot:gnl/Chilomastix_cuspidata/2066.p1 GENE.gnl/Chilomastix_cuspidata/2066~~gnl/Chilomastix_cuspidata/2066.p1  ORF type:complete len:282 (-),score=55.12 gnl/Chilomastix_cuspidata/2066:39-884(-)